MSDDNTIDLYKLEYEKAAERYENIYKAVWANFNYLTLLSGGIYAFGTRVFPLEVTAVLAILPLLFWWVAIFEPMNRYGDRVMYRLMDIEIILTAVYNDALVGKVKIPADAPADFTGLGLKHYTLFAERRRGRTKVDGALEPEKGGLIRRPRTRKWIRLVMRSLLVIAVSYAGLSFGGLIPKRSSGGGAIISDGSPGSQGARVAGVDMEVLKEAAEKNPKLKQDLDNLNKLLEAISNDVKQGLNGGAH